MREQRCSEREISDVKVCLEIRERELRKREKKAEREWERIERVERELRE